MVILPLPLPRQPHMIGPGKNTHRVKPGKWTGAELRAIRAKHGVGRPPKPAPIDYLAVVKKYGSQRKAAAALDISLGKLQRALRKAAA